jgi:hypothetical protein
MSVTLTTVSDPTHLPYGGAGDERTAGMSLANRFRRHADSLVRSGRSPLYVTLLRAAAADIDRGGTVAHLFDGIDTPPGSVPQLRLMAALHYLVLAGDAPALARFYPSAGGDLPIDGVWPAAQDVIRARYDQIRARLHRTVQTNEPGRAPVLFAGLLWLAHRHRRPIRLLEIGASAGLNLLFDRFAYRVGGRWLGDPRSPLRFFEPWAPPPPIDLPAAAAALRVVSRAGCDLTPLDPSCADDRLTLLSYIWPDELDRIDRLHAALSVAAREPIRIVRGRASRWLPDAIASSGDGELTVVWHSVFRQYVGRGEWDALQRVFRAAASDGRRRAVWLSMEPSVDDQLGRQRLTIREHPDAAELTLAWPGDHGLPIRWAASA